MPVWHLSQTISADPTLLAQGQEGQKGTPGVHLLPVFPASCFPQTNKLLRVEEVDRSGTQSRKLGAEVPASGPQQWKNEHQEEREAQTAAQRLSGSAAARLPRRDNHQSRGYRQADRPERVTKRDIRRAPESEKKERGQQKSKLKQSERKENWGLFGETRSWATHSRK